MKLFRPRRSSRRQRPRPLLTALCLWLIFGLAGLIFTYLCLPLKLDLYAQRSPLILDQNHSILAYAKSADGRRRFLTEIKDVDPLYLKLLLSSEDQRFYDHPGVDAAAIARAVLSNLLSLKTISGASTLDMQCIRMLEKNPRTLKYKIVEALKALKLRQTLGAEGVLQLYLTLVPMGADLEGINAGALAWFGHDARHLTPAEAALLTALPRAPELLRPDRHPRHAAFYVREVLKRALEDGLLPAQSAAAVMQEPLPASLKPIEQEAYYLGQRLLPKLQRTDGARELTVTIDLQIQRLLNALAQDFDRRERANPDQDLAVLVIDSASSEVKGYLGGRGLAVNQLDLVSAVRSPGSALKPFAYALAFERRLLHPQTLIADDSIGFHHYQPLNFNKGYAGFISAHDALIYSLNIPAVKILQRLSPALFFNFLNTAKERIILPRGSAPALPLVLGGCGISLYDLTALYSALTAQGWLREPQLVLHANESGAASEHKKPASLQHLLSARAAQLTAQILQDNPPPQGFSADSLGLNAAAGSGSSQSSGTFKKIWYKTGTSYLYADAWALGSDGRYTVGVWTGRRSGKSSYPDTGRSAAAPLLFAVLNGLPQLQTYSQQAHFSDQNSEYADLLPLTADLPALSAGDYPAPPALRFFDRQELPAQLQASWGGSATAQNSSSILPPPLKFVFPSNGARLLSAPGMIHNVEVQGGTPPYLLSVNGLVQPDLSFKAQEVPGFYELALIDAAGRSAVVTVRLLNGNILIFNSNR